MVGHRHNTFIESTSFNNSSFQLVVKFILISNSKGAQFAPTTASAKAGLTFFNVKFKLIVKSSSDASCFEYLTVPNNDPSLFLSFIGVLILEGARFAPTTYQAFELIVALIHQQTTIFCGRSSKFIVESFSRGKSTKLICWSHEGYNTWLSAIEQQHRASQKTTARFGHRLVVKCHFKCQP